MDFRVVLDVSSIIWCPTDFGANKHEYYRLVDGLSHLLTKLKDENPIVLLRQELLNAMLCDFPVKEMSNINREIEGQMFSFFMNVNTMVTYPDDYIDNLKSIPDLVKSHYNQSTQNEVRFLISKMHSDTEMNNVYLTFEYLCKGVDTLLTTKDNISKNYEVIISDRENQFKVNEIDAFFEKHKPVFEHNPKHDKGKSKEFWEGLEPEKRNGFISKLSCYNDTDNKKPQEMLDSAVKVEKRFIAYDNDNEVWVVFRCHKDNKWHGYDEYDEGDVEKIPPKIKKHFNK